ncbi:hypothetical protein B7H23_08675 [Notoacmeibacter marinus]|uniref:Uncharacterized protein n=1 Tax=Notoacmeibacter marinus TaxID=1876515 RepID=A0A231UWC2_9HYPH|nr:PGPGW domain-containing protein [Notoacmeibacter marinus]OXT00235.1 hypothetical protein B7H23_08675 [Notoacmeibacter marinus]
MKDASKTTPRPLFSLFGRSFSTPRSKPGRLVLGWALIAAGTVGFLPVVGFWMIPLGLGVLSIDIPLARRWRRRFISWVGRRWPNAIGSGSSSGKD